jgi:hypothetical protein
MRSRRGGKAKRAHHSRYRSRRWARRSAPLPTLRLLSCARVRSPRAHHTVTHVRDLVIQPVKQQARFIIPATHFVRVMLISHALMMMRAQGRPGADRTRGPRAAKKHAAEPQVRAGSSGLPCASGFTAYTYSPRGPAFLPPCRDNARSALRSASAPGCQDHTISPSASCRSSACEHTLRHDAAIAFPSNVRDDARTSPHPDRNAGSIRLIL